MPLSQQTVNVLRYSALGAGVIYGLYRQRKLTSAAKAHEAQAAYHHKEELIKKAKAEWARLHPKPETKPGDVITDPNDSRFDLEKFLQYVAGEKA
ncbi:ATP synthase E chain-domain-containing protein [Sphaerosporella brunnea]|uniref:ATP synthase F(0) complex subunit e, mitochondrial n=1 Tax=Sphaerosporella brunnea TaxID=1250544 RepID=A0A5J5ELK1_9PEZI|nr:ATP synthase E chain-domain-containing protein [Sphaerosporella brunnea]